MRRNKCHRADRNVSDIWGLVALILLGCMESVDAQEQSIAPLGRFTVGSKLSDVRTLRRSENCLIEGENADCTFIDSSGVAYVVLEDSVIAASVSEKTAGPGVLLPFGLEFGEGVDSAVRKLVAQHGTWVLGEDPGVSAGIVLSSRERFVGMNGWDFNVEIRFQSGRLVSVLYGSGAI